MTSFVALFLLLFTGNAGAQAERWCRSIDLIQANQANVYTANDLPSDGPLSKYRRYDGVGKYRLYIKANGRASHCTVNSSSGNAALDQSACTNMSRRMRFNQIDDPICADVIRMAEYEIRFAWDHEVNGAEKPTGIRRVR